MQTWQFFILLAVICLSPNLTSSGSVLAFFAFLVCAALWAVFDNIV